MSIGLHGNARFTMNIGDLVIDKSDNCLLIYLGKVEIGGDRKYSYIFVDIEHLQKWDYDWESVKHVEAVS